MPIYINSKLRRANQHRINTLRQRCVIWMFCSLHPLLKGYKTYTHMQTIMAIAICHIILGARMNVFTQYQSEDSLSH